MNGSARFPSALANDTNVDAGDILKVLQNL